MEGEMDEGGRREREEGGWGWEAEGGEREVVEERGGKRIGTKEKEKERERERHRQADRKTYRQAGRHADR